MTFEESMAYIQGFSKSGAPVKDLSRIKSLLENLGDPQQGQNFIHIAGTNGKGSTLALSSAAAIEAGFKTGQFTSPYMVRYNDRIRINGADIPDERLAELCTRVAQCSASAECSQFEITFAIALLYFKEEKCDLVFLETGIGGLLDAKHVIESPLVSVITSISPDHTNLLGNSLLEIASHKAGIIKNYCPVIISADNDPIVTEFITAAAERKSAPVRTPDFYDCDILKEDISGTHFLYHSVEYKLKMSGIHQVYNALTAIEIVRILSMHGYLISAQNVADAFRKVQVTARIQIIEEDPVVLLDGSHNQASVLALADVIRSCGKYPVILVCGMLRSKDYLTSSNILAQVADHVICVDSFAPDAVPAYELKELFTGYCTAEAMSLTDALPCAKRLAEKNGGIVAVCGSLYLAA
ncbi:MAG: bifunctional folylpolyglutamate synthase/dihydrofolate synthase, partial [Oscillospiraceae bacterium]|nr:bifunctional folylpolyglutamate synthase/dihydrofolate synthase [Oscillospiraceae bacterium]